MSESVEELKQQNADLMRERDELAQQLEFAGMRRFPDGWGFSPKALKHYCGEVTGKQVADLIEKNKALSERNRVLEDAWKISLSGGRELMKVGGKWSAYSNPGSWPIKTTESIVEAFSALEGKQE